MARTLSRSIGRNASRPRYSRDFTVPVGRCSASAISSTPRPTRWWSTSTCRCSSGSSASAASGPAPTGPVQEQQPARRAEAAPAGPPRQSATATRAAGRPPAAPMPPGRHTAAPSTSGDEADEGLLHALLGVRARPRRQRDDADEPSVRPGVELADLVEVLGRGAHATNTPAGPLRFPAAEHRMTIPALALARTSRTALLTPPDPALPARPPPPRRWEKHGMAPRGRHTVLFPPLVTERRGGRRPEPE